MGIAVGMATNIPPHNIKELIDCLNLLIKNPKTSNNKLLLFLQGPDFPTGGEVILEQKDSLSGPSPSTKLFSFFTETLRFVY